MKKVVFCLLLLGLMSSSSYAAVVFNPFTGELDFVRDTSWVATNEADTLDTVHDRGDTITDGTDSVGIQDGVAGINIDNSGSGLTGAAIGDGTYSVYIADNINSSGSGAAAIDITGGGTSLRADGVVDLSAADLEVPNGTSGTTDAAGETYYDTDGDGSTIQDGVYQGYNGSAIMYYFGADAYPGADNYILKYNAANNKLEWEADATGGTTAWDDIGNPDANDEIDMASYVIELNVEDFRIGDGGSNYTKWGSNGEMTFAGNAAPKKRIYISCTAGMPRTTSGCADAALSETSTNKVNYYTCDFDASTDEFWQFHLTLPENYDGGTFTYAVSWTCTADASKGVAWFLQLMSIANDDALDTAFGSAVESNDDGTATGDYLLSPESAAVTASGSPAGGHELYGQLYRDVSDSDDDLTTDGKMMGVWLVFGTDALTTED